MRVSDQPLGTLQQNRQVMKDGVLNGALYAQACLNKHPKSFTANLAAKVC